jgi:hypothetical protein
LSNEFAEDFTNDMTMHIKMIAHLLESSDNNTTEKKASIELDDSQETEILGRDEGGAEH